MGFERAENREASTSSHGLADPASPLLSPNPSTAHLSSQAKTFANLAIAIIGAGVLGLPYTFMRTGWAGGVLLLAAVAALVCYCMLLLVRTRRRLDLDGAGFSKIVSFGDIGLAVAGPAGRAAVDVMIVLNQAGYCVGYLIFISNTLIHFFRLPSNSSPFLAPKALYIWAMLPFQLGLNSMKTLTLLAPLSIFADVVEFGAMGVVLGEDVATFLAHRPAVRAFSGPSALLYGVGVAVYTFEVIGMVLPLEAEAADKPKFGKTLGLSMIFITVLYGLFGVLGYWAFGDDTSDIVTTNLGNGVVTALVQLGLCVNLFFTFPVMMIPVYEVVERRFCGNRYCAWLRWLLVGAASLVAMLVPNFADFLSLVGSSICIVLGFVLPAAFHLKVFGMEQGWGGVAVDVAIVVLGSVLAVSGTVSSLREIYSAKG